MRDERIFKVGEKNSMSQWWKARNPLRVMLNFSIIHFAKYLPSLSLKNFLYRLLGIKIGKNTSVGLAVTFDIFFPELIEIGENSLIGFSTTILTHEFLVKEWRRGVVKIGKNVMIGGNTTILPGVEIGDNAVVSACSLVNKSIPANSFFGGVPAKRLG